MTWPWKVWRSTRSVCWWQSWSGIGTPGQGRQSSMTGWYRGSSQVVKLILTKINVTTVLLLLILLQYERPKEWELIPESRLNMCLSVSPSVCMQITLGVLFIILPVRWILAYCWKFGCFKQPHNGSHALCAHNLFSPAWYIDSYLYWDVKPVPIPYLHM